MRVTVDIDVPKNVTNREVLAYVKEAVATHSATYTGYYNETSETHPFEDLREYAQRAKVKQATPPRLKVYASSAFGGPHTNLAIVVTAKSPLDAMVLANRRLNEADLGRIDSAQCMAEVPLEEGFTDIVSSDEY